MIAAAVAMLALQSTASAASPGAHSADAGAQTSAPLKTRNVGLARSRAAQLPRSEHDQAIVDGWPLYRTERGQEAFNDAMATLRATDATPPAAAAFRGCTDLECNLTLPAVGADGWIPAGRLWVSPTEYVLIVHSPRGRSGQSYRRRNARDMKYFVFHEFHNSSRNTDVYDTISSHSGSVFVPLYMSKQSTDARGNRFVIVVQVAPHDVVSIHAANKGSSGPGIEVAKNVSDTIEALQKLAGIAVATMIKSAQPQLQVVNHRGTEGLPMLQGYERRLSALRSRAASQPVTLPFIPAPAQRIATASARLDELIVRRGASAPVPMAQRGIMPPKPSAPSAMPSVTMVATHTMSPLAQYLIANLETMKRLPAFATIVPQAVEAIGEETPQDSVVYLLDGKQTILGRIEPWRQDGEIVRGKYAYAPLDRAIDEEPPFDLDFARPMLVRSAALNATSTIASPAVVPPAMPPNTSLIEPPRHAPPPACAVPIPAKLTEFCRRHAGRSP